MQPDDTSHIENSSTTPSATTWEWTPQRDQVAEMVAFDILTDREIARQAGINRATLNRWKQIAGFRERVEEIRARLRAEAEEQRQRVRETGFAVIEERVRRKNERLRQIEEVRHRRGEVARADAEWLANGGATGLVLRQEKILGRGESARCVVEYSLDTDLIKTEIALDDAIAKELGQHITRQEITGNADENRTIRVVFYDPPQRSEGSDIPQNADGS